MFFQRIETHLIKEEIPPYEKKRAFTLCASPQAAIDFLREYMENLDDEKFMIILLSAKNRVNGFLTFPGTIDHSVIYPRGIVKAAILTGSYAVIMVHNHPSGYCDPSPEDKRMTQALNDLCQSLDIRILDHIVIGRDGYFSFSEKNLLTRSN